MELDVFSIPKVYKTNQSGNPAPFLKGEISEAIPNRLLVTQSFPLGEGGAT